MRTRYDMFFFFSSRRRHTRYWRDWSSDVCSSDLALLRDRPEVVGGNYRLVFDGEDGFSRWLAGFYAAIRALGFWYGDSGIFVRRAAYDALGGVRPIAVMEDYDLVRRIRRAGPTACLAEPPLTTSSRRFEGR